MSERSLLRLSRGYERGQLTRDTYRRRRAELISAVLDADVADETVTDFRDRKPLFDKEGQPLSPSQAAPAESGKPFPIAIIGAAVGGVVVLGIILALVFGGDDEPSAEAPETAGTESMSPPSEVVDAADVLGSFTDEILSDGKLTDIEILNLIDLWEASPQETRDNWKRLADSRLESARRFQNRAEITLLENLYYELDVPTPIPTATARVEPPPAPVEESPNVSPISREAVEIGTSIMESSVGETSAVDTDEQPTPQPEVMQEAEEPVPQSQVVERDIQRTTPIVEPEPEPAPEPVTVTRAPSSTPAPAPVNSGATASVTVEEQVVLAPVQAAPEPMLEPTEALLAQQEQGLVRSDVDLHAELSALQGKEDSLDALSAFVKSWDKATGDEKFAFVFTSDKQVLAQVEEAAVAEVSRYSYEGLDLDERHTRLLRVNRIIKQILSRAQQAGAGLDAVAATGRMAAENLKRLDGSKYTLQLLASTSEQSVQQFVRDHDELESLFYVETTRDNAPWYLVLQGEYPTKNSALVVFESFPPDLRTQTPWSRTFEGIKELLPR